MHGIRRNTTVQVLTELYAESDQDAVMVTTRQALRRALRRRARGRGRPINVGTDDPDADVEGGLRAR